MTGGYRPPPRAWINRSDSRLTKILAWYCSPQPSGVTSRYSRSGPPPSAIFWLVLREDAVMIALGLLAGFAGIIAMRRAIESQLHAVSPVDPGVLAIAIFLMVGAAVAACLIPVRRATRLDPITALAES